MGGATATPRRGKASMWMVSWACAIGFRPRCASAECALQGGKTPPRGSCARGVRGVSCGPLQEVCCDRGVAKVCRVAEVCRVTEVCRDRGETEMCRVAEVCRDRGVPPSGGVS